jgi:hypothetical protein
MAEMCDCWRWAFAGHGDSDCIWSGFLRLPVVLRAGKFGSKWNKFRGAGFEQLIGRGADAGSDPRKLAKIQLHTLLRTK